MAHIDQNLLIKILSDSPAHGHLECIGWEPEHWVNLDGHVHHYTFFEYVSPTLYIDQLLVDTVHEVDRIIENMIKEDNSK